MRQFKYIVLCLLLTIVISINGYSQVKFISNLPNVDTSGFYDIELSAEQVSLANSDLLDIRIYQDGKEQPFITNFSNSKTIKSIHKLNPLQNLYKDSANLLVVEKNKPISHVYIALNKSDIGKNVRVRGGHDKSNWFIIKDESTINIVSTSETEDIYLVELPKNEYKYLEFVLTNKTKEAMEVLWIGTETKELIESDFNTIKLSNFTIKDSIKRSFIQFNNLVVNYKIDRIKLNVESDFGYVRNAYLNGNSFELSSKQIEPHNINTTISEKTKIEIANGDNSPLTIKSIEAYQLKRYITVYLKNNLSYTMENGSKNRPNYDLKYLINEIPKDRKIINSDATKYIHPEVVIEKPRELKWFEKPIFLWGAMGIVGLVLLFICYGMIKQMSNKKED